MIKKKIRNFIWSVLLLLTLVSCNSYKKVPYLQPGSSVSGLGMSYASTIARYQPDDILGITVNASGEPAVVADFNLPFQPLATSENSDEWNVAQGYGRQTYRVDQHGEIEFPVLGTIKVQGMTEEELKDLLKSSLKKHLKKIEPIINIRLMNYRISVMGEVNRPGQYTVQSSRINVLEALSMAGDMSIYGKRDNVRLVRPLSDGSHQIEILDLTREDIVLSPYFYLHQNDVLYVEPNKAKAKSAGIGSETSILISLGSILLSVASLIVMISK